MGGGGSAAELGHQKGKTVYLLGDLANQEVHPCLLDPSDPLKEEKGEKTRETNHGKYRVKTTGYTSPCHSH